MSSSEFEIAAEDSGPRARGRLSRTGSAIGDFLLRGGRLTKVAGAVASFAPSVGRSAPLAGASALALGVGLGGAALTALTPSQAQAACTDTGTVFFCTGVTTELSTDGNILIGTGASIVNTDSSGNAIDMTKFASGSVAQTLTQSGTGQITGGRYGIRHVGPAGNNGRYGGVEIDVRGTVTGTAANGDGIRIQKGKYGAATTITAANVTGGRHGMNLNIDAERNERWTNISWTGTVTGSSGDGFYFRQNDGARKAGITVAAASASGTRNGIYFRTGNNQAGPTYRYEGSISMTVSGRVTGGAQGSALKARLLEERVFKVTLNSGAVVGTGGEQYAVQTSAGGRLNLTVNSRATISGAIRVSESKTNDTMTFNSGSRGTLSTVRGVDTLTIESGAMVAVSGSATSINKVEVKSGAALHLNGSTIGSFTVGSGNFAGGGAITVAADFSGATPNANKLYVNGNVTGTTKINVSPTGSGATGEFLVVDVSGTVASSNFVAGAGYTLRYDTTNKAFYATRQGAATGSCDETSSGSGVFNCEGVFAQTQTLSATGNTSLSVTLGTGSLVAASGPAFELTSSAGISFTQTGNGQIRGGTDAIKATSSSTGSVSIRARGPINAGNGNGIEATNSAAGNLTVVASGAITASGSNGAGIRAKNQSGGNLSISAGNVTANGTGASHGIYAKNEGSTTGDLTITAGDVAGSHENSSNGDGIHAKNEGTGSLVISAGSVSADGDLFVRGGPRIDNYSLGVKAENKGADLTISVGDVSAKSGAVRAINRGTGATSLTVTGSARSTKDYIGTWPAIFVRGGENDIGGDITINLKKKPGAPADAIAAETHENSRSNVLDVYNYGSGNTTVRIEGHLRHPHHIQTIASIKGSAKSGDISFTSMGKISGGNGLYFSHSGTGKVTVSVANVYGNNKGGSYNRAGIYVTTNGTIAVGVTGHVDREISGKRQGTDEGWTPAKSAAAIHTRSVASKRVTITLNSGAFLDGDHVVTQIGVQHSGLAVRDEAGDATVTVNSGATATGKIVLGSGTDTLIVNSGATVTSSGTMEREDLRDLGGIDFGDGNDTLVVNAGATVSVLPGDSAHPAYIEMGAGDDTATIASGASVTGSVSLGDGDDTFRLGAGATLGQVKLDGGAGTDTLAILASATVTGTSFDGIEVVSLANRSAGDVLDVMDGLDLGDSGSVALDANFSSRKADRVVIKTPGNIAVAGTVTINVSLVGSKVSGIVEPLTIFEVRGAGGSVTLDKFISGSDEVLLSGRTENNIFYVDVTANPGTCDLASDGVYSCTGPLLTGPVLEPSNSGTPLIVNLSSGSISEGRAGRGAADLKSAGGIAFTSLDSSATLSGRAFGIRAANDGTGAVSIQVAGTVSATAADSIGIDASNAASGTGLSVSAASVEGGARGIRAIGNGSGDVRVTATGAVVATAASATGIEAVSASGSGLIVSAASVTGSAKGIEATNSGSGRLIVTATGAVSATASDAIGISAVVGSSGADLTIAAATVTGSAKGIEATSSGSGDVAVTATGTVSATASDAIGISAVVGSSGVDLTIAAATVTGSDKGIEATSSGSGDVAVTATGTVSATATDAIGIMALNNSGAHLTVAAATVIGSAKGIEATSSGSGEVAVTATGEVSGAVGIEAVNNSGTNLTVAAATVTGSSAGIMATSSGSGRVAVAATGDVVATDSDGTAIHAAIGTGGTDLAVTAAAVRGGDLGIKATGSGSGSVSVAATGEVSASASDGIGIDASVGSKGTGLTVSAASVRGPARGVKAISSGSGAVSVSVTGAVIATGTDGVAIDAHVGTAGTDIDVSSSDRIRGGQYGIKVSGSGSGAVSVAASGDVVASVKSGVHAVNSAAGSSLSISVANVEGNTHGVYAKNDGSGILRIATRGRVSGGDCPDSGSCNQAAIHAKSRGTATSVDVRGTVNAATGNSGHGIYVDGSGAAAVDIAPAAGVIAKRRGVSVTGSGNGDVRIDALGTVTSMGDDAIFAMDSGGGGMSIAVHGNVTGARSGIRAEAAGTQGTRILVSETGEVTGSGTAADHAGIKVTNLSGPSSVILEGKVTASSDAVRLLHGEENSAAGDLTVELRERAVVNADKRGVVAESHGRGRVLVSVNGVLNAKAGHGVELRDREASGGLSMTVGRSGVLTVTGSDADGVYARGKGRQGVSVDIRGDIAAQGARHGVNARADSALGGISVVARGIVAGGTAAGQTGIRTESRPGASVDVALGAGAIVSGGNAIEDGPGNATVTMRPGSRFAGNVKLGEGDDRLVIDRARYGTDAEATATAFLTDFLDSGMVLDGGAGADTLEIRGEQIDAKEMNSLIGANGAAKGWETFAIGAGGVLDLFGDRDSSLDAWLLGNRLESAPGGAVSLQNGKAEDILRVGDFVGGGRLWMDADFSGDGAVDRLEIAHGGSVSGVTEIVLSSPPRSAGQDTEVESQVMVVVEGDAKTDTGAFRLERNSAAFGAFSYQLDYRRNKTAEDHEFVLDANNRVSDTGAVLESTPDVLARGFGRVSSLAARSMAAGGAATLGQALRIFSQDPGRRNGWVRASSDKMDHGLSPNGGSSESKSTSFEMGLDLGVDDSGAGTWVYGMTASYGTVNAEATGATGGIGSLDASGLGVGAVATWVGDSGAYLDAHARYTRIKTDYTSSSAGEFAAGNSMGATVASVEVGRSFAFGGMVLVPQGQVSLTRTGGGEFTTTNGIGVVLGADSRLVSRIGVAAEFALNGFGEGGTASVTGTFEQASAGTREISFDGQALQSGSSSPKAELGFGVSTMVNGIGLYVDGAYRFSLESGVETEKGASLSGGMKWNW